MCWMVTTVTGARFLERSLRLMSGMCVDADTAEASDTGLPDKNELSDCRAIVKAARLTGAKPKRKYKKRKPHTNGKSTSPGTQPAITDVIYAKRKRPVLTDSDHSLNSSFTLSSPDVNNKSKKKCDTSPLAESVTLRSESSFYSLSEDGVENMECILERLDNMEKNRMLSMTT